MSTLWLGQEMKSYFLEAITNPAQARQELTKRFPIQSRPWVLFTDDQSDAIAYINVYKTFEGECEGPYVVQVDISGRHYNEDTKVIDALRSLQGAVGGIIRDDFDNIL